MSKKINTEEYIDSSYKFFINGLWTEGATVLTGDYKIDDDDLGEGVF